VIVIAGHEIKRRRRIGDGAGEFGIFVGAFVVDEIAGQQNEIGAIIARLRQGLLQPVHGFAAVIGADMRVRNLRK
jgi:hypothetical protein